MGKKGKSGANDHRPTTAGLPCATRSRDGTGNHSETTPSTSSGSSAILKRIVIEDSVLDETARLDSRNQKKHAGGSFVATVPMTVCAIAVRRARSRGSLPGCRC